MRAIPTLLLPLLGLVMASCHALSYDPATEARLEATAVPCCRSLAELPYEPLSLPVWRTRVTFDENTSWFDFDTGKSPFYAFELPRVDKPTRLTIMGIGPIEWGGKGWRYFYPLVLVLDRDKNPISGTVESGTTGGNPYVAVDFGGPTDAVRYIIIHTARVLAHHVGVAAYQGTIVTAVSRELRGISGPLQEGGSYFGQAVLTYSAL